MHVARQNFGVTVIADVEHKGSQKVVVACGYSANEGSAYLDSFEI